MTRYVHLNPVKRMWWKPGGLGLVKFSWLRSSPPPFGVDGLRRSAASLGGAFGGSDPAGSYRRYVTRDCQIRLNHHGRKHTTVGFSGAEHSSGKSGRWCAANLAANRRRESRLMQSLPLSRIIEIVCALYAIDRVKWAFAGADIRHEPRWSTSQGIRRWQLTRSWRGCWGCRERKMCRT